MMANDKQQSDNEKLKEEFYEDFGRVSDLYPDGVDDEYKPTRGSLKEVWWWISKKLEEAEARGREAGQVDGLNEALGIEHLISIGHSGLTTLEDYVRERTHGKR